MTPRIEIPSSIRSPSATGMVPTLREDDAKPSAQTAPSDAMSPAIVYVLFGDGEIDAGMI